MLIALLTLIGCQLAGELLRSALALAVPGPVIGMFMLAAVLAIQIMAVCSSFEAGKTPIKDARLSLAEAGQKAGLKTIAEELKAGGLPHAKLMGLTLFQKYGFHLQVVGLLLLVGTVGVVVLSKREKGVKDA